MMIRIGVAVVLLGASCLCVADGPASSAARLDAQAVLGEVPAAFRPFYQGPILPESRLEAVRAALPYERISTERSGGMLIPGGLFRLTLSRNGDATLWSQPGNSFGRTGDFVGRVSIFDFGKVCHLISQLGFERLAPRYSVNWTDLQTMTVTVTMARGPVVVADYGGAGPVELWSIERSIEAIGHDIAWKPK